MKPSLSQGEQKNTARGSPADVSATNRALVRYWRVGVDSKRDDGQVLRSDDGDVISYEWALGVPDRRLADVDGVLEDVQIGAPVRPG